MTYTVVVCRPPAANRRQTAMTKAIAEAVAQAGHRVLILPHPYNLGPNDPPTAFLANAADLTVAGWLYPRPLEWVLREIGRHTSELQSPIHTSYAGFCL